MPRQQPPLMNAVKTQIWISIPASLGGASNSAQAKLSTRGHCWAVRGLRNRLDRETGTYPDDLPVRVPRSDFVNMRAPHAGPPFEASNFRGPAVRKELRPSRRAHIWHPRHCFLRFLSCRLAQRSKPALPGTSERFGRGHLAIAGYLLWRQSDNVPFGQSRNVPLTTPGLGDAGRTATDDTGR